MRITVILANSDGCRSKKPRLIQRVAPMPLSVPRKMTAASSASVTTQMGMSAVRTQKW